MSFESPKTEKFASAEEIKNIVAMREQIAEKIGRLDGALKKVEEKLKTSTYKNESQQLEDLFNLPAAPVMGTPSEAETLANAKEHIEENKAILAAADSAIDKIDIALPTVTDLDTSDKDLDELSELAKSTFTDLIDLSMNVEPRFSGPILQSASTLLGHAVTAKVAKIDKKLKMVSLQLQKARLDAAKENREPSERAVEGEGVVIDRNELLKQILNNSQKNDK